ncbi:hypothetical protein ACO0LG_08760 [Undibacterium sp. Ji42W]|uniref:hypothetical protein n=1 Tax=Undibacterium sp. Ji42W TaxID=3413039 RepID=UPI003BF0F26F
MGLGIFLGSATKAYNEADAEDFRRKMLEKKQAMEDARFGREQRDWAQQDEADAMVKQANDEATVSAQKRGGIAIDQDNVGQLTGLNLNDGQKQQLMDAFANKGDVSALLKSFKGDPATQAQYQPAQMASGIPDPSKVVLPAATSPDASPIENQKLMQNVQQQNPAAQSFVGDKTQALSQEANGFQPQTGLSDEQWGNLRHYVGADGKTYVSTTAQRGPRPSELAMAHGQKLAQSGSLKNSQLGFQLMEQGANMHVKEVEQDLVKIMSNNNLSLADAAAQMTGLVGDGPMVPGSAQVVNTGKGLAVSYQAPGQEKPYIESLEGTTRNQILGNLALQIRGKYDSKLFIENQKAQRDWAVQQSGMDVNKAQIGNINAKTANETKEGNWIDARNKSAINAQNGNAAASYASAAHSNEATNEMRYAFSNVKDFHTEMDRYRQLPDSEKSPEKERALLVQGAMVSGIKSGDYTGVIRALGKDKSMLSKADEAQMDSYFKIMQEAVKTDPRINDDPRKMQSTKLAALQASGAQQGSTTWNLVNGGQVSTDAVLKSIPPKSAIPVAAPVQGQSNGTGLPVSAAPGPADDRVDVRNDPALSSLYNSMQGLDRKAPDFDNKMSVYGKAYNDQLSNLRSRYGRLTNLRSHYDQ